MLKVGVTGNIGSGKTIVCKIFELLNIDVYFADDRAKHFLHNAEVKSKIKDVFGDEMFDANGVVINRKLAFVVFGNPSALQSLNSIIHPYVEKDFCQWIDQRKSQPYILQEAAIIFESGFYKNLHKIIVVASSPELMIHRVMQRNSMTAAEVESRLDNQMDQQVKISKADYVIYNDGKQLIIPQIIDLHEKLISEDFNLKS